MGDIELYVIDMPIGLKGSVKYNTDGSYTILLNARYNIEQQREFYLHELRHIQNGDFDIDKYDAGLIENTAHC